MKQTIDNKYQCVSLEEIIIHIKITRSINFTKEKKSRYNFNLGYTYYLEDNLIKNNCYF